jgi:PPM family protein phosphatase
VKLDIGSRTDKGLVRENNEDSYRIESGLKLFVLSDGMGGAQHGEVASAIAVEAIAEYCLHVAQNSSSPFIADPRPAFSEQTNRLINAIALANQKILSSAQQDPHKHGMGATILAMWFQDAYASIAHVGDSRAYLLRSGSLTQLTADHSLVAEQVRQGLMTPAEAERSPLQSILTRALGTQPDVEIAGAEQPVQAGDVILLCSDGLSRMVADTEIAEILQSTTSAQSAVNALIERANQHGGLDNVTVIVVRVFERNQ